MEWGILVAAVSVFGSLALALSDVVNTPGPTDQAMRRSIHKPARRHPATKLRQAA